MEEAMVYVSPVGDYQNVEDLIFQAGDPDGMVQQEARNAIERMGGPVVPHLIDALRKVSDPTVRWRIAEALGHIGDPRAVEVLIQALQDPDPSVQWRAIEALADIGEPAADFLVYAMRDPHAEVRLGSRRALNEIRSRKVIAEKREYLDKVAEVLGRRP